MNEKNVKRVFEAAELERRAKQLRREEQAFLEEADSRKDELLDRWNITTPEEYAIIKELSDRYGCSADDLLVYLQSDEMINNYKNHLINDKDSDPRGDTSWP